MSQRLLTDRKDIVLEEPTLLPKGSVYNTFGYKGMQVDEITAPWHTEDTKGPHMKLIWVRSGWQDSMTVDGKPNPFIHHDYPLDDPNNTLQQASRRRVKEAFDKLWFPSQVVLTPQSVST